jgi:predicted Zn-dependent protease
LTRRITYRFVDFSMLTKRRISHAQGYLELGMVAEAAAELEKIGQPENTTTEVIAIRLAVLQEQAQWPQLRDLAREFVERVPGEPAAWVTWAYATRRAVSIKDAEKILLEAEQHHPAEATIQFNLGCYACQRGDLTEARTRVDRAIALDSKFAELAATDSDLAPLRASTRDYQSSG